MWCGEYLCVIVMVDIDWIGVDGNYVYIYVGGMCYLYCELL